LKLEDFNNGKLSRMTAEMAHLERRSFEFFSANVRSFFSVLIAPVVACTCITRMLSIKTRISAHLGDKNTWGKQADHANSASAVGDIDDFLPRSVSITVTYGFGIDTSLPTLVLMCRTGALPFDKYVRCALTSVGLPSEFYREFQRLQEWL